MVADAAPVAVVEDEKSLIKGGKRGAEVAVEKGVSAKKPKLVEDEALAVKEKEVSNIAKEEETSSNDVEAESESDDDGSSEEEEDVAPKAAAVAAQKVDSAEGDNKSEEDDSDDSEEEDEEMADAATPVLASKEAPKAPGTHAEELPKAGVLVAKEESEDDGSSEEEEEEDVAPKAAAVALQKVDSAEIDESEEDDSDEGEEEDEEMADAATSVLASKEAPKTPGTHENAGVLVVKEDENVAPKAAAVAVQKVDSAESDESEEDDSDEGEEEDEEMADATTPVPASKQAQAAMSLNGGDMLGRSIELDLAREQVAADQGAAEGTTVMIRGFSESLDEDMIRSSLQEHFGKCGEITGISIPRRRRAMMGMAYINFKENCELVKALELNRSDMGGRFLSVQCAKTRDLNNKGAVDGTSVLVKGFDKSLDEDKIRSSLQEHFGKCGEITRVSVPTIKKTGQSKGIAYIDFKENSELIKALELNGSDMEGHSLNVTCAPPKTEGRTGGLGGSNSSGGCGISGNRGGKSGGGRGANPKTDGGSGGRGGAKSGGGGRGLGGSRGANPKTDVGSGDSGVVKIGGGGLGGSLGANAKTEGGSGGSGVVKSGGGGGLGGSLGANPKTGGVSGGRGGFKRGGGGSGGRRRSNPKIGGSGERDIFNRFASKEKTTLFAD